jgi:hypothetical protein
MPITLLLPRQVPVLFDILTAALDDLLAVTCCCCCRHLLYQEAAAWPAPHLEYIISREADARVDHHPRQRHAHPLVPAEDTLSGPGRPQAGHDAQVGPLLTCWGTVHSQPGAAEVQGVKQQSAQHTWCGAAGQQGSLAVASRSSWGMSEWEQRQRQEQRTPLLVHVADMFLIDMCRGSTRSRAGHQQHCLTAGGTRLCGAVLRLLLSAHALAKVLIMPMRWQHTCSRRCAGQEPVSHLLLLLPPSSPALPGGCRPGVRTSA